MSQDSDTRCSRPLEAGQELIPLSQFALWYVTPSLGEAFFGRARQRALFDAEGGGPWRGRSWGHPTFLLNYGQAEPGRLDALPLNVLRPDLGTPPAMRDLLLSRTDLLLRFAPMLFRLQPQLWEVLEAMAQTSDINQLGRGPTRYDSRHGQIPGSLARRAGDPGTR